MKIILLSEESFNYLMHVFGSHTQGGFPLSEIAPASELLIHLQKAQTVDMSKLGKAEIEKLGTSGVALNLIPGEDEDPPNPTVNPPSA